MWDIIIIASCKAVVTADQSIRGGKVIELKKTVDEAVTRCGCVENVFMMNRTGAQVPWQHGRDVKLEEVNFTNLWYLLLWLLLVGNGATIN